MNDLVRFAQNVQFAVGKKRGRRPVFNSRMFYPYKEELRLRLVTKREFERYISEAYAVAIHGESFSDDMSELLNLGEDLPEQFKSDVNEIAESIGRKVSNVIAESSEMIVGKPYYPPGASDEIFTNWEANFQMLCKSAETDVKKDIARLITQGKNEGWNGKQLERAVMGELPEKYANRASLIARTESAKLNTEVTRATYHQMGVRYYMWMATMDERTRPDHAMMNGLICSVDDPTVYFDETPEGMVEQKRDGTMVHMHPGEDYQCRCTMVMWDPAIDGKYEVKENPAEDPEEKDPTKLEQAREETEKEKTARLEAESKLRLMTAANKRHMERTPEHVAEIQARWDERNRRIRIRQAAEKRHAERDPQKILKEMNKRIQIRAEARTLLSEFSGIEGINTDPLQKAISTGNSKKIKKAMAVVEKKKKELESLQYVQNPLEAARRFDYDTVMSIEKSIKAKVEKWDKYAVPLEKRKELLEYEIKYVQDKKKYASWEVAVNAYKKLLEKVNKNLKIEKLKTNIVEVKQFSQSHKKFKNLKKWLEKLEGMVSKNANYTELEIEKQLKKVLKEQERIKKLEYKPGISGNANTITSAKYGVENGVQKKEMPSGFYGNEKIEAIKELTLVPDSVAVDFNKAVYGFSYQWDYEIRAFQVGNKKLVSKHGHSLAQIEKKAIDIEEFIDRSPKWDGGTTYRGISLSKNALNVYINIKDNGLVVDMRGSASWSTSEQVSKNFARMHIGEGEKIDGVSTGNKLTEKVLFVNSKNQPLGTSIAHLSHYAHEHEILCSKKSRYKITGYHYDNSTGYHYFVVEPM